MTKGEIKLVIRWCLPIETTQDKLNELAEDFINNNPLTSHNIAVFYRRCYAL
jgi:hypothetical protein